MFINKQIKSGAKKIEKRRDRSEIIGTHPRRRGAEMKASSEEGIKRGGVKIGNPKEIQSIDEKIEQPKRNMAISATKRQSRGRDEG